jgi:hypothetical protein
MKKFITLFCLLLPACAVKPVSVVHNPVVCSVTGVATICTQSWVMPNRTGQVVRPVIIGDSQ